MFYSKSTGGFYTHEVHGDNMPADVVEISESAHQLLLMAQADGKHIVADANGRPIAADPPKASPREMWRRIQAERERRMNNGGTYVASKWFHSDPPSKIQQLGLVMMGQNMDPNLQWKTMDGTFVLMTPELAQQILQAAAANEQQIFAVAEQHRIAMENSEEPWNYDFSTGWPQEYVP